MKWDVYKCWGGHLIIVEHKDTWSDHVQTFLLCDICRLIAEYEGSIDSLSELESSLPLSPPDKTSGGRR